jgi:GntR family transcriptional regulator/MocR family aminotransferase
MLVRLSDQTPLHLQVYRAFREAILKGDLAPGSRLPSSRAEARTLGVSRNVVLQAYDQLEAEGYIGGARGSGTYVASEIPDPQPRLPRTPPVATRPAGRTSIAPSVPPRAPLPFDFAYGLSRPDERTMGSFRRAARKAIESLPLDYGPPEGDPTLRETVADYLFRNRAVRADAENLVIVSGSQQGLSLVSRVLFEPGDRLYIEDPCYQGAREIFRADGIELVPCPVGAEGLVWREEHSAKAVYVTPSHQFPTGVTMPIARRLQLLSWAEERDAFILEDDYDSEYRYQGRPLESIQGLDANGRVVYLGTFSKVLFPALRLGYVVLPADLVSAFVRAKWLSDRQASLLEQRAVAELLRSGEFDRHLRRARVRNQARREALLEALESRVSEPFEISGENAGIHLVVWFPERTISDVERWVHAAEEIGVGLYSVAPYFLCEESSRPGLLFGYGNLEESQIAEGIRRFAGLLRALSPSAGRAKASPGARSAGGGAPAH